MKVTQDKEFTPITIILETEREARIMKAMFGKIRGDGLVRDFTSAVYDELAACGIEYTRDEYFSGDLRAVK